MINDGNINQKQPLEYQLCPREEISFPFNRFSNKKSKGLYQWVTIGNSLKDLGIRINLR